MKLSKKSYVALFGVLILTLILGVTLQLFPARVAADAVRLPPLADFLPREIPGWVVNDLPLGETEGDQQAVKDVLKYDDAILRTYSRGGYTFAVHVVYWRPETSMPGEVRSHSPDFCFPASGWKEVTKTYERSVTSGEWSSAPAQYRVFAAGSQRLEMLFWHLRAGELSGWIMGEQTRWGARLPYLIKQFWRSFPGGAKTDEVFVRITAPDGSLNELLTEPAFQQIAGVLAQTGVFKS